MNKPIAKNISLTFIDDFADVSKNRSPLSSAYACASSYSTTRLAAKSALLPESAITILGDACRWSSRTQFFALAKDS